ncbi:MAG: PQQ-binding-like beta-propeller repeat protein [Verrucomicrobia bacterium]|jgi:outer membrane protein assembly factor BamB|nr:PQQ-binding-like beta-propeller repeat protein [Verrucomicrobiota bacterium]
MKWFVIAGVFCWTMAAEDVSQFWPQWRGPLNNGVGPKANPPLKWSEDEHVRWKAELPGKGHSTPIIWEDTVFVTCAIPVGPERSPVFNRADGAHDNLPVSQDHFFSLLAFNRQDGSLVFRRDLNRAFPHEGGHDTGSLASASPVTDGKHIIVSFGSHGLYGLTMTGEVVWKRDFGKMQTRHAHGEGSSPALYADRLVVNWDHEGTSAVYCLDKSTGKEFWSAPRDESTSWSTPLMVEHENKVQIIVSATGKIRSYDLQTGKVIWECGGLSRNVVATPVTGHGMVVASNSYDWQAMLAIRLEGAQGDLTGTDQIVWSSKRLTPYVPSPLLYGKRLYFLRHLQGILSCVDLMTGEPIGGPYRLPLVRVLFASPVGAADRIYITSREGITLVMSNADDSQILSVNRLDDIFSASPALVGKQMFLRGEKFLYCLETAE